MRGRTHGEVDARGGDVALEPWVLAGLTVDRELGLEDQLLVSLGVVLAGLSEGRDHELQAAATRKLD